MPDYLTYSLNTNAHPRIWSANAAGVYQWWLQRSNAQTSVGFSTNGSQALLTVSIARAVVHDPPVLIFDEATVGLDVLVARALLNTVAELRDQGKCVVFSTHIMREAERLCDRIAIICNGQILAGGMYVSAAVSIQAVHLFSGKNRRTDDTSTSILTDREFEVFQFIGQGLTTREMGQRLRLSPKTVETHRLHIREKLRLHSGPELIQFAVRWTGAQELI